jgi:hypothetical protein
MGLEGVVGSSIQGTAWDHTARLIKWPTPCQIFLSRITDLNRQLGLATTAGVTDSRSAVETAAFAQRELELKAEKQKLQSALDRVELEKQRGEGVLREQLQVSRARVSTLEAQTTKPKLEPRDDWKGQQRQQEQDELRGRQAQEDLRVRLAAKSKEADTLAARLESLTQELSSRAISMPTSVPALVSNPRYLPSSRISLSFFFVPFVPFFISSIYLLALHRTCSYLICLLHSPPSSDSAARRRAAVLAVMYRDLLEHTRQLRQSTSKRIGELEAQSLDLLSLADGDAGSPGLGPPSQFLEEFMSPQASEDAFGRLVTPRSYTQDAGAF